VPRGALSFFATITLVSIRTGEPIADSLRDAVVDVLARHGYQPEIAPGDEIAFGNRPFHPLAEQQRKSVCGMNFDFLRVCSTARDQRPH
jgi:hypothetical protein